MKTITSLVATLALLALTPSTSPAATYIDNANEGIAATWAHLDILSVDVNNTATTLSFQINLRGDPTNPNWGKYLVGIDSKPGGDPAGNGWARPIGMNFPSGMDYFLGSWADSGTGAELRAWNGAWSLQDATYSPNPDNLTDSYNNSSVTLSFNYAGLGLAPGSTFAFDVYTTGGGGTDSAVDALANPNPTIVNWSDNYNSGTQVVFYTIVPEPATCLLLGLGGLVLIRRTIRRRV
jgi:hypothetical protein